MLFSGFQKLTLLDYPGKVACTVFTGGCNFRCPYCHNSDIVLNYAEGDSFTTEEILDYLKKRKGVFDGICVSGGEPLMHTELADFLKKVKELDFLVKIDTNGSYPDSLSQLIDAKLVDYIAMDIKNSLEKYASTIGLKHFDTKSIEKSVNILMTSNCDYEFRTTVCKEFHTMEDFESIGKWIAHSKAYFLQNYKDSGSVMCEGLHSLSKNELIDAKNVLKQYIANTFIRGE